MRKTYRRFSTEFKLHLVEAFLAGEGSMKALASKAGINHSLRSYWIGKHRDGTLSLELRREEDLDEAEEQIAGLERKVGQLTMELDLLKRGLISVPARAASARRLSPGRRLQCPARLCHDWHAAKYLRSAAQYNGDGRPRCAIGRGHHAVRTTFPAYGYRRVRKAPVSAEWKRAPTITFLIL